MYRYALLNFAVMSLVAIAISLAWRKHALRGTRLITVVTIVLVFTIIFDHILVIAGFVDYDPAHITGLKIYGLPIEDLDYALVTAVLMPFLWEYPSKKLRKAKNTL